MTHVAQGLDVACFGSLKTNYGLAKRKFEEDTGDEADGSNFLQIYAVAHRQTFTPELVKTAFRTTGIVPFDRNAISAKDIAPSKELSTENITFPVAMPTPVKVLVDACRTVRQRRQRANSTPSTPSPSRIAQSASPNTPRHRSGTISEWSLTNTQRAVRVMDNLATTSASYLVSDSTPFTSASRLPAPVFMHLPESPEVDWDDVLASPGDSYTPNQLQDENEALRMALRQAKGQLALGAELLEAQNAQLALQNLYLEQNRRQLQHQEKKKTKNATDTILNTEMGRIFTSDEFMAAVKEDEARHARERLAVDRRAAKKKWIATERQRIKVEWLAIRGDWEAKRDALRADGKKSGWGRCPAKPKRAPTPDILKDPQEPDDVDGQDLDGFDGAGSELEDENEIMGNSEDSDGSNADL